MKLAVFDSGLGGEAVAQELRRLLPDAQVSSFNDHEHVPYGGRPNEEIITLTAAAIQPLIPQRYDAIIIACNTATTVAISNLRQLHPSQVFIGIEPMIKPAALATKTGRIAVLATPATLQSQRYQELKNEWAQDLTVIEPDCRTWASLIEKGDEQKVPAEKTTSSLVAQNVDVIVLACTHYHWIKERIETTAGPHVRVLEPSDAITRRIKDLISSAD